jgi:uncharacterized protein YgiM (DUF1202 family)
MAGNKTVYADALIAKFQYAIDVKGGYIWGAAGAVWTAAKQAATTNEQAKKYGKQWIGHQVWDCSGLFSWAFKELGGYMYHGSNTMWDKYCTAKGQLKKGQRADGKELKPGTAVFVYNEKEKKRSHVGLYIGNGNVIEAASTQTGVVISKVTNAKWEEWGELKGVEYGEEPAPEKGYAVVTGKRVALRQEASTRAAVIMRIDTGETVKLEPEPDEWDYVSYKGKKGWMMKKFLKEG